VSLVVALLFQADIEVSVYAGQAWTLDGDVKVGGRTTRDVDWDDESFRSPIYYGIRASVYRERWGLGLDFFHAKVYLDDAVEGLDEFAMSHGYNVVTANVLHRWPGGTLTPYGGAGLGAVVAHVEANAGAERTSEYQLAGPAVHGLAGLAFGPVFVEAKAAYAWIEADTAGGAVKTALATPQIVAGLTLRF